MTKIKICGITNYEDARNSADLGADFLGFNFYRKSPRYIDYKAAADVIRRLPKKIRVVGIFVNDEIKNIEVISNYCKLDLVQLSGNETNGYITGLREKTYKGIIKCVHIRNLNSIKNIKNLGYDYLMLDSFKRGFYGGTGQSFDLAIGKSLDNKKLFLAGGINKDNVGKMIQKMDPYAVDVCSGIEARPGKKDLHAMKQFIEAVK